MAKREYRTFEAYQRAVRRRASRINRAGNNYQRKVERANTSRKKVFLSNRGRKIVNNAIPTPRSFRDMGILGLVTILLILAVIFRVSSGFPNPSFSSFLEVISNSPVFDISLSIPSISTGNDWGIFEFMRNFINGLISITNFGVWLSTSLVEVLLFIFYFLGWIFGIGF